MHGSLTGKGCRLICAGVPQCSRCCCSSGASCRILPLSPPGCAPARAFSVLREALAQRAHRLLAMCGQRPPEARNRSRRIHERCAAFVTADGLRIQMPTRQMVPATCFSMLIGPRVLMMSICVSLRTKSDPANPNALIETPSLCSARRGTSIIHRVATSRL